MSSMVKTSSIAAVLAALAIGGVPAGAQDNSGRASLVAQVPSHMTGVIDLWERLTENREYRFSDYSNFLLTYPGFPDAERMQLFAEARLAEQGADQRELMRLFDRHAPITAEGMAHYALAQARTRPDAAAEWARKAWRAGQLSANAEANLGSTFASKFTTEDYDERIDALLWQRDIAAANRVMSRSSEARRPVFLARLQAAQGIDHDQAGYRVNGAALSDPGYLYNRSRQLRSAGQMREAITLLSNRPPLSRLPHDQEKWLDELLLVARQASPSSAYAIAASIDDAFAPDTDISTLSYPIRDDYTSLMWLGGTKAMWERGFPNGAAALFYRYGNAARTPQTRSKGFYWAGRAAESAGQQAEARDYYTQAAQYGEYFYGLLALERLQLPRPSYAGVPAAQPTPQQRSNFYADPLVMAVRALASTGHKWQTKRKYYMALTERAQTEAELVMVGELAEQLRLPELAVVVGRVAPEKGFANFSRTGFPTVETPRGAYWTMVHAIARQESEFDDYRISHAGARGFMQLMPGTAREQAGKEGIQYLSASLLEDTQYNIRLGSGYFRRMLSYYNGSYPLAVAAYNAGPGNVNKWLRANGDPRRGGIDWLTWIESIPIFETKNYVQRVLENAVVYETMYPELAGQAQPRAVSTFLR